MDISIYKTTPGCFNFRNLRLVRGMVGHLRDGLRWTEAGRISDDFELTMQEVMAAKTLLHWEKMKALGSAVKWYNTGPSIAKLV